MPFFFSQQHFPSQKDLPLTSHNLDLSDSMAIPQDNTDLRRSGTLLGQLADLVDDLIRGGLQPGRGSARVRDRGGRDTFAIAVETAHFESWCRGGFVGGKMGCRLSIVNKKNEVESLKFKI